MCVQMSNPCDRLATPPGVYSASHPIRDGIHSSPSCQCVTAFDIILHLTFWWDRPISQKAAGSIIIIHWGHWVRHLTMTGFLTVRRNHLKIKEVLVYLWCHCGRARWADARRGWSVWIAAVFAHGVGRCPRSQRKGWRDCAPPPWRGLSPSPSPHLGEEQQKIDRQRKRQAEGGREERREEGCWILLLLLFHLVVNWVDIQWISQRERGGWEKSTFLLYSLIYVIIYESVYTVYWVYISILHLFLFNFMLAFGISDICLPCQ